MAAMEAGYAAVARLYHAWVTGLILTVVTQAGAAPAAELAFRLFRRQQREKFLPGLAKLGLAGLPDAVASARYHYLSNRIGGVRVEYIEESPRKAWIRYPPPRWMWQGTAICAVPSEVSRAMLRGWHAENGVALGNPGLGFVCTKQTVDEQDALEGYFLDYGRALLPEERLRFSPGEAAPLFDPATAPRLPEGDWSPERLAKAARNYAIEYLRSALPELYGLFGAAQADALAGRAAYLVGMQLCEEIKALLGVTEGGAAGFAELFRRLAAAQGEAAVVARDGEAILIRQRGWRLLPRAAEGEADGFQPWNRLWEGCLAAHDRSLRWSVAGRGEGEIVWRLARG
ncbi:MAG: hypothetical protein ACLQJR_30865 [Stellaceae bacterium]